VPQRRVQRFRVRAVDNDEVRLGFEAAGGATGQIFGELLCISAAAIKWPASEKYAGDILGDLGQHVARTGAKQGVGGRAAKSHAGARFLLGQLQQHQQNQKTQSKNIKTVNK
jgi:hypothetical protein